MDRFNFEYTFDLAETITSLLNDIDNDYPVISVYGKYDVIKELLEELIVNGNGIANEIELHDYDVKGYNKEFVLYITENGINIEKVWYDGKYYSGSANITFIHEDCSSTLLKSVDSDIIYEFAIGKSETEDKSEDCDECKDNVKDDIKKPSTKTTSASKSVYKVNGKEVSKNEYEKTLKEMDDGYIHNVHDMLLSYFDFIDEMNQWRRLLRW